MITQIRMVDGDGASTCTRSAHVRFRHPRARARSVPNIEAMDMSEVKEFSFLTETGSLIKFALSWLVVFLCLAVSGTPGANARSLDHFYRDLSIIEIWVDLNPHEEKIWGLPKAELEAMAQSFLQAQLVETRPDIKIRVTDFSALSNADEAPRMMRIALVPSVAWSDLDVCGIALEYGSVGTLLTRSWPFFEKGARTETRSRHVHRPTHFIAWPDVCEAGSGISLRSSVEKAIQQQIRETVIAPIGLLPHGIR